MTASAVVAVEVCLATAWQISTADAKAKRSVRDGVYTEAQAKRGKDQFEYSCARCHLSTLEGDPGRDVPALVGEDFLADWRNHPVGDLFVSISKSMPADSPATLDAATYVDILVYILQVNKFPAGNEELGPEMRRLESIVIQD
jgi:mono/diheme cytochrome c family protein